MKSAKHRLKPGTYLREAEGVKALNKHFGAMPLHRVQMGDWENYKLLRFSGKYSVRGKGCSDGTVKKEFRILRSILAYAMVVGFVRRNVLSGFKSGLSDGNRSDIWLTKGEIDLFLRSVPDKLLRFRQLFEFRIWTGARPEEATLFGKNNVDWSTGEIWLLTGKKRKKDAAIAHKL